MGYNIRTGLVEEHREFLQTISDNISRGESVRYRVAKVEQLNSMRYQLYRLLKATTVLINECGGAFVGLRQRVKIREDYTGGISLVVEPAKPVASIASILPSNADENDTLERLKQFEGEMDLVRFTPSYTFDLEEWRHKLQMIGFDLMPDPDKPDEWIGGAISNGDMDFAVARTKPKTPTGFDLLKAQEE